MENKTQDLTQRGVFTSASNAQADLLCRARHLAQQGIPEKESEDASHGTQIHNALKLQNTDGLDPDQEKTYEACNEIEERAVATFFPEAAGSKSFPSREVRYWIKWADGLQHSGQLDSLHVLKKRALIVEYKTLPGDVPSSSKNLQLRDQASLLAFNVPELEEIGVVVIQPLVTRTPEITLYNRDSLAQASAEMYFRVRASNTPGQDRNPGEVQCKFCLAKSTCVQYNQFASGLVIASNSPTATSLMATPITQWTPEMQVLFLDRMPVAQKWLDECKATLKALLKEKPDAIPGYTLGKGRTASVINDAEAVFARFNANGGQLPEFMKCVEVGKGKLELAVRSATKLKGKAAEAKLKEIIGDSMTVSVSEPSIVKAK